MLMMTKEGLITSDTATQGLAPAQNTQHAKLTQIKRGGLTRRIQRVFGLAPRSTSLAKPAPRRLPRA